MKTSASKFLNQAYGERHVIDARAANHCAIQSRRFGWIDAAEMAIRDRDQHMRLARRYLSSADTNSGETR